MIAQSSEIDICIIRDSIIRNKLAAGAVLILRVGSGSMRPAINIGDEVVVKASSHYQVGDVIAFSCSKRIDIHRIIKIKQSNAGSFFCVTKGDANCYTDSTLSEEDIIGKVIEIWREGDCLTDFRAAPPLLSALLIRIKRRLVRFRSFIKKTLLPLPWPNCFLLLWQIVYRLAANIASCLLKKRVAGASIFIARGYSVNEIIPLSSDIDLFLVCGRTWQPCPINRICAWLETVRALTQLVRDVGILPLDLFRDWLHYGGYRAHSSASWRLSNGMDIRDSSCLAPLSKRAYWWEIERLYGAGPVDVFDTESSIRVAKRCLQVLHAFFDCQDTVVSSMDYRQTLARIAGHDRTLSQHLKRLLHGKFCREIVEESYTLLRKILWQSLPAPYLSENSSLSAHFKADSSLSFAERPADETTQEEACLNLGHLILLAAYIPNVKDLGYVLTIKRELGDLGDSVMQINLTSPLRFFRAVKRLNSYLDLWLRISASSIKGIRKFSYTH